MQMQSTTSNCRQIDPKIPAFADLDKCVRTEGCRKKTNKQKKEIKSLACTLLLPLLQAFQSQAADCGSP